MSSPSKTSNQHTKHTGLTPKDAYNVITDPDVLPTLDKASIPHKIGSSIVFLVLLSGALFGAYLYGVEILQTKTQLVGAGVITTIAFAFAGGSGIDWWGLVLGYWWFSMPVAAAAGLAFLVMQESASGIAETN